MTMTSPAPKQIDGATAAAIKKNRKPVRKFDTNGKPQQKAQTKANLAAKAKKAKGREGDEGQAETAR
jgi:hypothetical protein